MKKITSILVALALTASTAISAFSANNDIYSTDTQTLTSVVSNMEESEKQNFIDDNLDIKLQHLSTFATLSANRNYEKIAGEVKDSLDDGVTAIEIKEAVFQSAPYCGFTRAAGALDAVDNALKDLEEDIPYKSRMPISEENRYDEGLVVRRKLFGPQMGIITDDMSAATKLQQMYLSGICFGDFYNRTGLDINTREFLTFCTIAGNGNCAGQLRLTKGYLYFVVFFRKNIIINNNYIWKNTFINNIKVIYFNNRTSSPSG